MIEHVGNVIDMGIVRTAPFAKIMPAIPTGQLVHCAPAPYRLILDLTPNDRVYDCLGPATRSSALAKLMTFESLGIPFSGPLRIPVFGSQGLIA
jgi:hypothetical protein